MTNRSRLIVTAAILLALGIAISVLLLLAKKSGGLPEQTVVFSVVIVFAAALSIPAVYFLKIRKNKIERLLDKDYLSGYETIKDTVRSSNLPKRIQAEILNDVLDLMVTARHNNRTLRETIVDPFGFAREIVKQYGSKRKYSLATFLESLIYMAFFILGVSLLMWLEGPAQSIFNVPIDFAMLVFLAIVSFWLVPYLKLNTAEKPKAVFLPVVAGLSFIAVAEILRAFFYASGAVQWFLDGKVNILSNGNVLAAFLIAIPGLILLVILVKKSRFSRIGKNDSE